MGNKKKRNRNRALSEILKQNARNIELSKHICENCGESGGHWINTRVSSLEAMLTGVDDQQGFWTCSKYYGKDGKRLPEHIDSSLALNNTSIDILALIVSKNILKEKETK